MTGRRPLMLALALACAGMTFVGTARADLPPPEDIQVCSSGKVGDPCEAEGKSGVCVAHTCSRLDYSGGVPPKSVSYECLRCDSSGAAAPETKPETTPETTPKPEATPVVETPEATPEATPVAETPAEKSSEAVPVESRGACSVVGESAPGSLALVLLVLLGRRRRR